MRVKSLFRVITPRNSIIIFLSICVAISFWLFARFTVDDAFITWRYGKNLIKHGIWAYNPTTFDLTQAYTNPIYAILSIIPAAFDIDVVLFFKLISIFLLVWFFIYMQKKTNSTVLLILMYASPVTFIHAFSGLETFLFVTLVVVLFIALYEERFWLSIITTILLFFTRPESWPLLIGLPLYYLIRKKLDRISIWNLYSVWRTGELANWRTGELANWRKNFSWLDFAKSMSILMVILASYFTFNKLYFGYVLPNTFYVKSSSFFSIETFLQLLLAIIPLLLLNFSKRFSLLVLFGGWFFLITFQYSFSTLGMNYAERFLFHLLIPVFCILLYNANSPNDTEIEIILKDENQVISGKGKLKVLLQGCALLLIFYLNFLTIKPSELIVISNYYPQLLNAHSALGKELNRFRQDLHIKSFAMGDAGASAFQADLINFDEKGLGSSLVAHSGPNIVTFNKYNVDVVVFYGNSSGLIYNPFENKMMDTRENQVLLSRKYQCSIVYRRDYSLEIYSRVDLPSLQKVCNQSKELNGQPRFILRQLKNSPTVYWRE